MKYMSRIFQPLVVTPKTAIVKNQDITSKSQKLMHELGIVRPSSSAGLPVFLPLGQRSLDKLVSMVRAGMEAAGAQAVSLPSLAARRLWERSDRMQDAGPELMTLTDRHDKDYVLCPTHEELVTDLIASVSPVPAKQLPLKLYQIGSKFRDEMRPRYGVIRSREFLMKDLYTFDIDEAAAKETYRQIGEAYDKLFTDIGVEYVKVEGATGTIGGSLSHEYHYPASVGEDQLFVCKACGRGAALELLTQLGENPKCVGCGNTGKDGFNVRLGIEVGHTFLLGSRYSAPLGAVSVGGAPLQMGCYGVGLSRLVGAALEAASTDTELRWPNKIVPYHVCIIGPKSGSKEESSVIHLVEDMYTTICQSCQSLKEDIIIDDRSHMTIGKRIMEGKRFGYPHIIVVGSKAAKDNPEYEILDTKSNETSILSKEGIIQMLQEYTKCHVT